MTRPVLILTGILLSGQICAQETAQGFSTLFTTPAEREYLDFLRQDFLRQNPQEDFNIDEDIPPVPIIEDIVEDDGPAITRYQLSGIFMQANGSRVVWLNGSSIQEADLPDNMQLLSNSSQPVLRISTETGRYDLKAGQTLTVNSGEIQENWRLRSDAGPTSVEEQRNNTAPDSASQETAAEQELVQVYRQETLNPGSTSEAANLPDIQSINAETINAMLNGDNPEDVNALIELLQAAQEAQENADTTTQ